MPRYKLTVAYDGTNFHGWQKQESPDAQPLRTAQGVLEEVVRQVVREAVNVDGASRTDSGVHARGQTAAFTTQSSIEPSAIMRAINSRLPADALITAVEEVSTSFEPISHALRKQYRYSIHHGHPNNVLRPLFDRHFVAQVHYALDPDRMRAAAAHLVGEHDFASFTRLHHGRESTVRTVDACEIIATDEHRLYIDITGPGFLYNMVRIIAGTLVEVGRGKFDPEDIPAILAARDRAAAGPTMPPEGLCLMWIAY